MNSMTGYGRGESMIAGTRCVIECTSVNRKGLEIVCQLPRELTALEISIRDIITRYIARGRINVSLTLTAIETASTVEIDQAFARNLLRKIHSLQKELLLPGKVDINSLLMLPGIIRASQQTATDYESLVMRTLKKAISALAEMRAREGKSLHRDLTKRLTLLCKVRTRMLHLAPTIVKHYRTELKTRIERSGLELSINDMRLATEVAIFAERCDVTEELTRLESHFTQFAEKLEVMEPVGRALEFLVQEIYRELNTIGSKAGDSRLARLVVDSKVELDKIREQALNVE